MVNIGGVSAPEVSDLSSHAVLKVCCSDCSGTPKCLSATLTHNLDATDTQNWRTQTRTTNKNRVRRQMIQHPSFDDQPCMFLSPFINASVNWEKYKIIYAFYVCKSRQPLAIVSLRDKKFLAVKGCETFSCETWNTHFPSMTTEDFK